MSLRRESERIVHRLSQGKGRIGATRNRIFPLLGKRLTDGGKKGTDFQEVTVCGTCLHRSGFGLSPLRLKHLSRCRAFFPSPHFAVDMVQ